MNINYYIFCPENVATGGTELLHQFADYLNSESKYDAFIIYYNSKDEIVNAEVPERFKIYNTKSTTNLVDSPNSIIVLPEVCYYFSKKFTKARFLFWWLSYDNYLGSANTLFSIKNFFNGTFTLKQFLLNLYLKKRSRIFSISDIRKINDRIIHGYQSQYVHEKLFELGFYKQLPLSDYISTKFLETEFSNQNTNEREDIILYNPAKGIEVTREILKKAADKNYKFIPLQNLNQNQLADLFSRAKLYIDFGNHPGKDRLPREAALQGCLILVGNRGSAQYFEDVLINDNCKVNNKNINQIISKIEYLLNNYEVESEKIELYKTKIKNEKKIFFEELDFVLNVFEKV